jgi:hypothetical protein
MIEHWNQRYDTEAFIYGREPNLFFKEFLDKQPVGKLLLPCEGEGRNAVYAASLGWEVTAFDQSEVGMKKALAFAREQGVTLHYGIADALAFDYPSGAYDVIAFLWAHFPQDIRRKIHQKSLSGLKQGGFILLEGFNKKQLSFASGGPKDPEMLFSLDYWPDDFPGLKAILLEEAMTLLDEGDFHRGEAAVIKYLGRKT